MPTPTFFTGFEHKILAACGGSVVPADAQLWDEIAGTPQITTVNIHHGGAALRIISTAATEYVSIGLVAGTRRKIGSVAVQFVNLPTSGDCRVISASAGVGGQIIGVSTAGFWFAESGGGTRVTSGLSPTTGVWYIVDYDWNTSANPNTVDWRIDGTAQTQATGATAAQDMTAHRFGSTNATTVDMILDCATLSDTAGDYPLGHYKTLGYLPDSDFDIGQASNGAFVDASAVAIDGGNPAWDNLLDMANVSATTRVEQTAISGTGYINVGFAPSAESTAPIAVMAEVAMRSDTATTTNGQVQIDDAFSLDTFTGLFDPSETTNVNRFKCLATKPSGGAWTDAAFNALRMRIGYSTDANPDPWFVGLMFEALFADPVASLVRTFDPVPFIPRGRSL